MKVTYLPQFTYFSRVGESVECRNLEIGETAICGRDIFTMTEQGLCINGTLNRTIDEIMAIRGGSRYGCNRIVRII